MKARRLCALLLCALLLSGCGAAPLSQSPAPAVESAMPSAPAESPEAAPASDVTVTEDLPDALRFSVSLPALPDSPYDLERCFSGADEHDCAFCYPDFCEQWVEDGVIRLSPRRFFGRIFLSSVRRDAPDAPQTLLSLLDTAKWGASANEMTVGSGHDGLRMSHLKYDTYRRWIVWEAGDRYYTLYAACFDANGGVFEPLLTAEDAIISDSLNHASIIDGVRLCKAQRFRYANADMADLEAKLQEAQACRFRIIVTDGVFSMDGNVAPTDKICDLAEKYDALVMVDESHSAGVDRKSVV